MKPINFSHIWLIAKYSVRFSMRNGSGIIFLLTSVLTVLMVAAMFLSPIEALIANNDGLAEVTPAQMVQEIGTSEDLASFINWFLDSESEGQYLLQEKPALVSCIFLVLLMLIPYLVIFGSFNQTSGDISNRGLRFLLLRTERPNIFLGRYLGTVIFCLSTIASSIFLLLIYIHFKLGVYVGFDLFIWGLRGAFAFFALSLPFIAICAWISAAIDSPFASLTLSTILIGLGAAFLKVFSTQLKSDWLNKTFPTGWKYELLSSDLGVTLIAHGALLLFTVFFLYVGLKKFQTRDL